MEDFLLRVEHVSKHYSGHTALDDVSLDIPRGSVYGLLGPNGAGKTTLIRIVNRITAPDEGRVLFDGRPLASADVQRIGYLPEERGLYKKMKVGEQALFFARLKGLSRAEAVRRLRVWFDRFDIASWWNRRVEELSKGMAQKVQFIVTVLHEPELLIFDEPFSGFDPINANLLKEEILGLRDRGATVIFSTHNMSSVEEARPESFPSRIPRRRSGAPPCARWPLRGRGVGRRPAGRRGGRRAARLDGGASRIAVVDGSRRRRRCAARCDRRCERDGGAALLRRTDSVDERHLHKSRRRVIIKML